MKLFPRGAWGYAVLLVILFSIAAIATKQVIDLITERFILPEYEQSVQGFSVAIWLLTMGLMFLAGALGLLAISTTAEYESRHRIARIVNAMNYLSDGLLAVDYHGHIRGANPAVRKLAPGYVAGFKKGAINNIFPSLRDDDLKRLLDRHNPCEIEVECYSPSGLRVLRLRSQPAEGLLLVFVSDITEMHSANLRRQQTAKLQLLGRIAGGVAHDFSNILGAISGHASLIQRLGDDKRSLNDSIEVIQNETERGVRLSRQLLVLSRSSESDGQSSSNLVENVREAEELLRVALSAVWHVEARIDGVFPVVPLSPVQIVQIILNLGLLAADALKKPGTLLIQVKQPDNLSQDIRRFAAVITILASAELVFGSPRRVGEAGEARAAKPGSASADAEACPALARDAGKITVPQMQARHGEAWAGTTGIIDTTGIIPSVVRTLIEEAGGRLDELYASNVKSLYRVCLPHASKIHQSYMTPLKSVIKGQFRLKKWKILLASSDDKFSWLIKTLEELGAVVEKKSSIDAVLGVIDSKRKPDVIIADKRVFGDDAEGLLKAVRKISPNSGIVIMSAKPEEELLRNERGFIFLESDGNEDTWLDAIVRSRQT